MPNLQRLLEARVADAVGAAFPDAADAPPIVVPAQDPRFGDYQANGAMALAKRLKRNPRDVAAEVVAHLAVDDLCEAPEIAGPGFINLRLKADWVAKQLGRVNAVDPEKPQDRLGVPPAEKPETVVVDYSAPNLAKEMHVGHLRSTIIGDALVRMLDFLGHNVIRQNHVGDWGTQFGMLVAYLMEWMTTNCDEHDPIEDSTESALQNLEEFYRRSKIRFDGDEEFAGRAREIVVGLQSSLPEIVELWENLLRVSMHHCRLVYERLGVLLRDADIRGESAYNDDLPNVIAALAAKGLLTESEGAQCVFLPGFANKEGEPLPFLVQKSDEGYLYATTDLAAIRYRVGQLKANRILYVVDARQGLHFRMLFAVARAAGFASEDTVLEHVAFGTMMGEDGRPFKTREGGTVKLMDLLEEAERRALALVNEKNPDLPADEKQEIARKVGIGAVKYADLSQNRTSDYVFSWDKMLSLQGNTAPYMQYAYARVRSIFRKGGHEAEAHRKDDAPIALAEPAEVALGKMILRFPEAVDRAVEDYRPNTLATYLYDLAQAFTGFYDACPVIQSEEPLRTHRLELCDLTARVIAKGLELLGIETAERM